MVDNTNSALSYYKLIITHQVVLL